MAVGPGGEGRDLGDQPDRRHVALLRIVDVLRVRIEGRERADVGEQHAHRVGVVAEALVELLDVLVGEGVVGDVEGPALELGGGGELAEDQEVGDLEVGRVLAELLDRDAAVLEDAGLAVDVGDRGAAGGGVGEGRVVAHQAEVVVGDLDLPQVHRLDGPVGDLELVGLAGPVVGDAEGVAAGGAVLATRPPAALPSARRHGTSSLALEPPTTHIFSRWRYRQTGRARRRRCASSPACRAVTTSPGPCSASARTPAGGGRWCARSRHGQATGSWTWRRAQAWSPRHWFGATAARWSASTRARDALGRPGEARSRSAARAPNRARPRGGRVPSLSTTASSTISPSPTCSATSRTRGQPCPSSLAW